MRVRHYTGELVTVRNLTIEPDSGSYHAVGIIGEYFYQTWFSKRPKLREVANALVELHMKAEGKV